MDSDYSYQLCTTYSASYITSATGRREPARFGLAGTAELAAIGAPTQDRKIQVSHPT